ncbi:L-threonylcarbamoyladenylate synthase [Humibacter sp. RRB41]|uniref:L-threonylcarbamoyladenylate synthase n=1 Tax=Humibacter sp. RRB41 TaxID=2919946 RepID=UPI001FA9FFD5|nr:L-threonylcarbamoyladenylate synthase [Humibacter sp. RRB41]
MTSFYDCSDDDGLAEGIKQARAAVENGDLIVLPTDTVYGIGADAFSAAAVTSLLEAKGRGRQSPPPVLIPALTTLDALAETVPQEARDLAGAFWPGGLTIVLPAQPSLAWDLGETKGTVALRMPNNPVALALLRSTGPLAVSSANKTGLPAATTAHEAEEMLGDSVVAYLDGGSVGADYAEADVTETSSTIVDATALAAGDGKLRILRHGVISDEQIRQVVGDALETESAEDSQQT